MSIAKDIRAALRAAPGPITADELVDACGADYTKSQLTGNINSLVKTGEVLREKGEQGFTYLLDPDYVPKKRAAGEVPPPKAKQRGRPPASKAIAKKTIRATPRAIAPAPSTSTDLATISVARTSARAVALAVVALHPKPLPPDLKQAVLETMQASL